MIPLPRPEDYAASHKDVFRRHIRFLHLPRSGAPLKSRPGVLPGQSGHTYEKRRVTPARFSPRIIQLLLYTIQAVGIKCIYDILGNIPPAAAGVHGLLFYQAVGFGLGHLFVLDQKALGPADQAQLGQLCLDAVVLPAAAAAAGWLLAAAIWTACRNSAAEKGLPTTSTPSWFIRGISWSMAAALASRMTPGVGLVCRGGAQLVPELVRQGGVYDHQLKVALQHPAPGFGAAGGR